MCRITKKAPYGQHINLYCVNHPEKRWSTKNIDSIGCRSLFYNLGYDENMGPECDCKLSDLRVVEIEGPDVAE
jgi:hypothetical protein